jgi:hypothetical protein
VTIPEEIVSNDKNKKDIVKCDMRFRSYGIFTFWILPGVFLILFQNYSGLYVLIALILLILAIIRGQQITFISKLVYNLSIILFGVYFERETSDGSFAKHKDRRMINVTWFLFLGMPISMLFIGAMAISSFYIIPALIYIWYRKSLLRFLYVVTFLPSRQFVEYDSRESREAVAEKLNMYKESDKEYMLFFRPSKITHIFAYAIIIFGPFFLGALLIPIDISFRLLVEEGTGTETGLDFSIIGAAAFLGILAIIPYLLIFFPFPKKFRLTRWVVSTLVGRLVKTITETGVNNIPLLSGDYFIERKSTYLNMSYTFGFFEIFKRGRLFTIVLFPLALIAFIFRQVITRLTVSQEEFESEGPAVFIVNLSELVLANPITILSMLFIIPIVLSFLLPIIFVLSDAELKRSRWREQEDKLKEPDVFSVEDVGKSINNIVKLVLGVGTFTSLYTSVQVLLPFPNGSFAIILTLMLIIYGAILIFPGTLFLVYTYFARGDHVYGVNFLRHQASISKDIGVGTLTRSFNNDDKLSPPPDHFITL